jgi:oxygen-independent coproporphyrinogen-3 oxidase
MSGSIELSAMLFNKYHRLDKQYRSYPTLEQFQHPISPFERFSALRDSCKSLKPLALNISIPFCANACYYCTSKNIVTKDRSRGATYLRSLEQEIPLVAKHINTQQPIEHLHFGGGTPTFLNPTELRQLMSCLKDNFNISSNKFTHYSIDIDPRETDWSTMGVLREIGFNRVNIEVQGLDPAVQRAINRLQTIEQTQNIVEAARTLQFRTIRINLIYGLPKQTPESFTQALTDIIKLTPGHINLQGFQHLPHKYPIQTRINAQDLPQSTAIAQMLNNAQQLLSDAGYIYIGMGHFALADDDLASAQEDGTLQYGIHGYSSGADYDTIGFGISAISQLGELYYRNTHDLGAYQTSSNNQQLAPAYGLVCNTDDQIRRSIIQALTCHFSVDFTNIEQRFKINAKDYFHAQWHTLQCMHDDGLLTLTEQGLKITEQGRLFTLAVCQVFDHYFTQEKQGNAVITRAI